MMLVDNGFLHQDYDFMIVKLRDFSSKRRIVLNRNNNYPEVPIPLTVGGMGITNLHGAMPKILQQAKMVHLPLDTCKKNNGDTYVTDSMVCARSAKPGPCLGDSGGPLFDSQKKLVGVVSHGFYCDPTVGAVFSRVSYVYDWIMSKVCDLSERPPKSCKKKRRLGSPPSTVSATNVMWTDESNS